MSIPEFLKTADDKLDDAIREMQWTPEEIARFVKSGPHAEPRLRANFREAGEFGDGATVTSELPRKA